MRFAIFLTQTRVVIGCLCAGALAAVACADPRFPTSPGASEAVSGAAAGASASFPRSGALHVTKECSEYLGRVGDFCTITSSNLPEIEVGSRIIYASALDVDAGLLDSDVVLDPPGPGNNRAFGHCRLELATGAGRCEFSGGTGKFTWFKASANVSFLGGPNWAWDGTYSFRPHD